MADHKLILHPQNANVGITNFDCFVSDLCSIGLITGDSKEPSKGYFQTGSRFLELVDFIQIRRALLLKEGGVQEVVDNYKMCFVQLIDYGKEIKFHGMNQYTDSYYPCCPVCGLESDKAVDVLSAWWDNQETYRWLCQQCGQFWCVYDLNWRGEMAFVRCAIDIWHIHPNEALPSQELLEFLHHKTGGAWKYFYYRF
ncbi:hypothetical protein IFO70_32880 [Phormidium tenue FACHB-886]|nr:hypothetical protein [Phormidium tenue FACHB-886]